MPRRSNNLTSIDPLPYPHDCCQCCARHGEIVRLGTRLGKLRWCFIIWHTYVSLQLLVHKRVVYLLGVFVLVEWVEEGNHSIALGKDLVDKSASTVKGGDIIGVTVRTGTKTRIYKAKVIGCGK